MLKRTPEPELMDDLEQAVAYDEADFRRPTPTSWSASFASAPSRAVVDLGCGPGNLALRIAAGCPGHRSWRSMARRRCSPGALAVWRRWRRAFVSPRTHRRTRRRRRLRSMPWSATAPPPPPRSRCPLGDDRARRPAGRARLCERPPPAEQPEAVDVVVAAYAADAPDVLRRDFRASLHAAFTPDEILAQLDERGWGDWRVEVTSDRHVVVCGRVPA